MLLILVLGIARISRYNTYCDTMVAIQYLNNTYHLRDRRYNVLPSIVTCDTILSRYLKRQLVEYINTIYHNWFTKYHNKKYNNCNWVILHCWKNFFCFFTSKIKTFPHPSNGLSWRQPVQIFALQPISYRFHQGAILSVTFCTGHLMDSCITITFFWRY